MTGALESTNVVVCHRQDRRPQARERLNKGLTHEKWNRNFFSQRQGGRLRAVLGRIGLSVRRTGAVRALYPPGNAIGAGAP